MKASRSPQWIVCLLGLLVFSSAAEASKALVQSAERIVAQMAQGQFATAHKQFAPEVNQTLSVPALKSTWASVTAQLGAFQKQLGSSVEQAGTLSKVRVSCQFERLKMDIEVVFNGTGQVVGFFIRPPLQRRKAPPRPQTPVAPFPYDVLEVTYPSTSESGHFGGTLTRPKDAKDAPAILLLTGSGAQDRDQTIYGHKPFAVLADDLTRRGFIVLRVDDRGVGATTVAARGATIQKHARDAIDGFDFLRKQPGVDHKRVGILGHSEGGLLAALVAAERAEVAYLVLLGAPGLSGAEINPLQVEAALKSRPGVPARGVESLVQGQRALMKLIRDGKSDEALLKQLKVLQEEGVKMAPPAARAHLTQEILQRQVDAQLKAITSPWFRSFVSTEPEPILAAVRCPVLALLGERDMQVPSKPNLAAFRAAFSRGGNRRAQVVEVDGVNHLFQEARTGAVSEYASIQQTISPGVLERISAWLKATTERR